MLLTFLASNSFGSDEANVTKFMVRLIEATKAEHIIGKILCVPGPSTEALGEKLFQEAISLRNLQLLRVLLDSGLDLNSQMCRCLYGGITTPLCRAIKKGNFEVVELLLEHGADPNGHHKILDQQDLDWPLIVAIRKDDYDLVELLIKSGVSLESEYEKKYQTSALLEAAASLNPKIVRLLLENKAEVDFVTQEGENCLIKALPARWGIWDLDKCSRRENISDIVQQLVKAGAALDCRFLSPFEDPEPKTVLERAADLGHEKVFQYLLDRGAGITSHCVYYAARGGNEDLVRFLLDQELDPSSSLDNLEYPLLAAIREGHYSIARMLIEHGVEVKPVITGRGFRLYTPLQAACVYGDLELVPILLDRGADVNAQASLNADDDYDDQTALSAAIDNRYEDIVCMLLDAGADANAWPPFHACDVDLEASEHGTLTALQAAISLNDAETVSKLLIAGANVNVVLREHHECETPLTQAIEGNNYELIHRLIDGGADINNPSARLYGRTALEAAAKAGNSFHFRRLLSMGADPFDPQALLVAVEKSLDIEIVKALLEKHKLVYGQFRKGFGGTALQMAVKMKKMSILETLLDAGIPADSVSQKSYKQPFHDSSPHSLVQGETAFGTAIRLWEDEDMSQFVMKLLSCGANPSGPVVVTIPVKTALVATIEYGKANLLQMLLEAGANVAASATGKLGRTALQAAAASGRLSMVKILIEHGAQVNDEPAEDGGVTALQAASIGGYTAIVSLLLSKGANINAPCAQRNGRTALEGAAEHGRIDMIQLLLDAGAAVHDEGERQYKNSVQFAKKGGHLTALRLLQRHHAASMVTSRQAPEQQLLGMDWQSSSELGAGQTLSHDIAPNFSFDDYISPLSFTQPDGAAEPSTACWDVSFPLPSVGENNPVPAPVLSTPSFDIAADFDYPSMDIEDIFHTFDWDQPPEQCLGTSF
ncbi:hypothetical protein EPUS_00540 [Endocarpon pusillum Z07020]|uniref:Uncharacterized protein n=1 Tax=Endocarpon pusillum (strain Z07020 / HMAS-L-300199) TaxID=1263415 RepID=U1GIB7_ENDPU|nr:uncharacterized protein EPUS_00540 [Endocarpon pusillum Z07020]ERF71551.1 hypothetical protein EPUS_00540 [Endocarpon pusillum Z07020]